jgi:hypothetical protein
MPWTALFSVAFVIAIALHLVALSQVDQGTRHVAVEDSRKATCDSNGADVPLLTFLPYELARLSAEPDFLFIDTREALAGPIWVVGGRGGSISVNPRGSSIFGVKRAVNPPFCDD